MAGCLRMSYSLRGKYLWTNLIIWNVDRHSASAFNPVDREAVERIKHSIASQGYWQQFPVIVSYSDKDERWYVIDGWHRILACRELKIEPTTEKLNGDVDPSQYSATANLYRRQISHTKLAFAIFKQPKYSHLNISDRVKLLQNLGFKLNTANNIVKLHQHVPPRLRTGFLEGGVQLTTLQDHAKEKRQKRGRPASISWNTRGELASAFILAAKKDRKTPNEVLRELVVKYCQEKGILDGD